MRQRPRGRGACADGRPTVSRIVHPTMYAEYTFLFLYRLGFLLRLAGLAGGSPLGQWISRINGATSRGTVIHQPTYEEVRVARGRQLSNLNKSLRSADKNSLNTEAVNRERSVVV